MPLISWAVERGRWSLYYGRRNQYEKNQRNCENGNYNYYNGGGQGGSGGNWSGNYGCRMCECWNIACKYRVRQCQQQWQGGQGGGGRGEEQCQHSALGQTIDFVNFVFINITE